MFSFDRKPKPNTQRSATSRPASPRLIRAFPPALDARKAVRAAERGGTPIPAEVRALFEPRFGHDFGKVRVHADAEAAAAARALHAQAYTVGRDIVFGAGEYAPGTSRGKHLLAHELAHVIQQEGGSSPPGFTSAQAAPRPGAYGTDLRVSRPGDAAEREADGAAAAVLAGGSPRLTPGSAAPAIHRRASVLPESAKAFIRQHGRGELTVFLDKIITDGKYREVLRDVIDGVEHVWEVRAVDIPGQEWSATFGGAIGEDADLPEAEGKRIRHRRTFILRSGVSNPGTVLHELIHLRISIDRDISEEKRSSFYKEYAQMMEIATDEMGLGLLTGVPAKKRAVLAEIEQLRKFFVETVDPAARDKLQGAANVQPGALVEYVVNEKYANQTASAAYYRVPLNNDTIATRYSSSVAERFRSHCDPKAASSRLGNPVGSKMLEDRLLSFKKALVAFYDQIDQQKQAIEDFKKKPPAAPEGMLAPGIFETRPVQIGGAPVPLPPGLGR